MRKKAQIHLNERRDFSPTCIAIIVIAVLYHPRSSARSPRCLVSRLPVQTSPCLDSPHRRSCDPIHAPSQANLHPTPVFDAQYKPVDLRRDLSQTMLDQYGF